MGFLSKLMKNPLMQMIAPMALTAAMGPLGAKLGTMGLFKNMSPLMANAIKQSALGFGTSALSGSKRPWKGAMYAGLTSIPFSYMSAANAANAFNKDLAGVQGWEKDIVGQTRTGVGAPLTGPHFGEGISGFTGKPNFAKWSEKPIMGLRKTDIPSGLPKKLSPWEIMTGKYKDASDKMIPIPEEFTYQSPVATDKLDPERLLYHGGDSDYYKLIDKTISPGGADIFTKPDIRDNLDYGTKTDWLPTAASQAAALYGGRMTPEEEWEATRKKRKKELAWMYGVDEDQIEGEMDNPWYSGGMFNSGGIASLENGGGVNGPGTGTSDSIDAKLSDGEFVMTAKAVENLGDGDRYEGARKMYAMMNMLDPESETMSEVI